MRFLFAFATLAAASGSPATAQVFQKEEGRAAAAVEQMRAAAARLQTTTQGASLADMRARFNKPPAKDCQEHAGDCQHDHDADRARCEEHHPVASPPNEVDSGLCTPKGHDR